MQTLLTLRGRNRLRGGDYGVMDAILILYQRQYPIPVGDLVRIGTMNACDIRISNDTYVSRRHCSVSFVDDRLSVVDLGSTHGTFVNGKEVGRDPIVLQDGDRLQVGATVLTVSLKAVQKPAANVEEDEPAHQSASADHDKSSSNPRRLRKLKSR